MAWRACLGCALAALRPGWQRLLLLLAVVAATGCASLGSAPPAVVTFAHINDVYEIEPVENGRFGGPARWATVFGQLRQSSAPVIVTLGGDYLSPSALGTAKVDGEALAGRQMVDVLNAVGVDLATFGNHEFDVSEKAFRRHLTQAHFKLVSSNVTDAGGAPFAGVATSLILPVQAGGRQLNIGVIGVTVDATATPWVRYRDRLQAAREEIARLRGRTDALVAITHLPLAQDAELLEALSEIDLVLGGHEHENWHLLRGRQFAPIVKADANGRSIAVVTMAFGAPGERPTVSTRWQLVDERVPADPAVAAIAQRWTALGFAGFSAQGFKPEALVAITSEALDGREATVRNRPGRLTDLIAQAMARAAGPVQAALFNGGSVRIDDVLPAGPITEYDVIRVLPFGGKVVTAELDGELLVRVLDSGAGNQGLGGYLQTWGIQRTPEGEWRIAGRAIDPKARYRVALTDFLLTGAEVNMGYLRRDHPQVHDIRELGDIRKAVMEELGRVYLPATGEGRR